jgi:prenyltransferase beta subunit
MKGVKANDCYLDTFDSIWKNLLEDVGPNIEEKIKEKFEYYSVEISDSLIQKAWEVISGLVLANIYYDDTNDANDARSRVYDWISKDFKNEIGSFKGSNSTLSDRDFTEICRMAFREFLDEFRDIKRKVAEKFADEYNISRDTFLSFINEVDLSEINPFL